MTRCPTTGKRCFGSERAAKEAHRRVHNKIRTYFCAECKSFHASGNVGGHHR